MSDKLSYEELEQRLANNPPVHSIWKHYKGGYYKVILNCIDEATQMPDVIYLNLDDRHAVPMRRTLHSWNETVTIDGQRVPRFERMTGPKSTSV